jgi:hypothetical protein
MSEPPLLPPPPGFSPTPHFVPRWSSSPSILDLNDPRSHSQTAETEFYDGFSMDTSLGSSHISNGQSSRKSLTKPQECWCTTQRVVLTECPEGGDLYHIGDGLPPRDPGRQSIARNKDGQRRAWIITPGRRGAVVRGQSYHPETHLPLSTDQHVSLRGGAGEPNEATETMDTRYGSGRRVVECLLLNASIFSLVCHYNSPTASEAGKPDISNLPPIQSTITPTTNVAKLRKTIVTRIVHAIFAWNVVSTGLKIAYLCLIFSRA